MPRQVRVRAHTQSYPRRRDANLGYPLSVVALALAVGLASFMARAA
jgi:hypothetical protein